MRKKIFLLSFWIVIISVLVLIPSCNKKENKKPEQKVIKIGAILPLTGPLSFLGEPEKNAIKLFLKENNNSKLKVFIEDSMGRSKEALTVYRRMKERGIDIVITSLTPVSLAVKPLIKDSKIAQFAFCMAPNIVDKERGTFRLFINVNDEGEKIIEIIKKEISPGSKIGIIYAQNPELEFEAKNVIVSSVKENYKIIVERFDLKTKDFRSLLEKMRNNNISNIIVLGFGNHIENILRTMLEIKYYEKLEKIIGGIGFFEFTYKNLVGFEKIKNKIITAAPVFLGNKNKISDKFIKLYEKEYGKEPTFDAFYMYDLMGVINDTIKSMDYKYSKKEFTRLLTKKKFFNGVAGHYILKNNGDFKVQLIIKYFSEETNGN